MKRSNILPPIERRRRKNRCNKSNNGCCEMRSERHANGNEASAEATVPAPVELQAVCDATSMAVHSWFRLAACSFCLCVPNGTTVHPVIRESSQADTHTESPSPSEFVSSTSRIKNEWSFGVELKSQTVRNEV